MIEINLLPGSAKRTKRKVGRGMPASPLSKLQIPPIDKVLGAAIGMWAAGILLIVWMQLSSASAFTEIDTQEKALIRDTANLNRQLAQNAVLRGKQDTIGAKLLVIQELDAGRYNWSHIMDEISRALPDYMWLIGLTPLEANPGKDAPTFAIEGRMANSFALPIFMKELEASPFISNVTLRGSGSVVENQKSLYSFTLEATYEQPPADMIQTEPLFGPGVPVDSAIGAAVKAQQGKALTSPLTPDSAPKPPAGRPGAPAPARPAAVKKPGKN